MKVQTKDQVTIITGKDKGKKGEVMRAIPRKNQIVVKQINIKTKFVKKTAQHPGEIIKFEAPINTSNAMVICPNCSKPTRIGYTKDEKNKKIRVCKKCKEQIIKSS